MSLLAAVEELDLEDLDRRLSHALVGGLAAVDPARRHARLRARHRCFRRLLALETLTSPPFVSGGSFSVGTES